MPKRDRELETGIGTEQERAGEVEPARETITSTNTLKVKGSKPPHGGKWTYDKERDELTCVEEPTKER